MSITNFSPRAPLKYLNSKRSESLPGNDGNDVSIGLDPERVAIESERKILEMLEFPLPKRLWQLDNDVRRCSVSNCRFRTFLKKHHCRICGKVVCTNCSRKRLRGYRICDICRHDKNVLERFPELLRNKADTLTDTLPVKIEKCMEDGTSLKKGIGDVHMDNSDCGEDIYSGRTDRGTEKSPDQPSDFGPFSSAAGTDREEKKPDSTETSANLGFWKTAHCVLWIMSLGLGKNEEKVVQAMKQVGLCGSDLQTITDDDLLSELKIYSAIHRRRILYRLKELTQEEVDEVLKQEEMKDLQPLTNKDLIALARDVKVIKEGKFVAIDQIKMLNSPEYKYQVEWYATNIPRGIHKVTVIDLNEVVNSSHWVIKYDGNILATHSLTKNSNALRWRLHNSSVEVSVTNAMDQLNTDLVISLQTVTLPKKSPTIPKMSSSFGPTINKKLR